MRMQHTVLWFTAQVLLLTDAKFLVSLLNKMDGTARVVPWSVTVKQLEWSVFSLRVGLAAGNLPLILQVA
jgi:hypothetical protein